jgi:TPR repeat protein
MSLTGKNAAHNFVEGAKWALRSAEQGNSVAQGEIADLYNQGVGVEKNPIEADKWLILSIRADETMPDNVNRLKLAAQTTLEHAMSAADVAEAHRRADAWKPKPETQARSKNIRASLLAEVKLVADSAP